MAGVLRILVGVGLLAAFIWFGAQITRAARSSGGRTGGNPIARAAQRVHGVVGLLAIALLIVLLLGVVRLLL